MNGTDAFKDRWIISKKSYSMKHLSKSIYAAGIEREYGELEQEYNEWLKNNEHSYKRFREEKGYDAYLSWKSRYDAEKNKNNKKYKEKIWEVARKNAPNAMRKAREYYINRCKDFLNDYDKKQEEFYSSIENGNERIFSCFDDKTNNLVSREEEIQKYLDIGYKAKTSWGPIVILYCDKKISPELVRAAFPYGDENVHVEKDFITGHVFDEFIFRIEDFADNALVKRYCDLAKIEINTFNFLGDKDEI